jgi:hypothetical protein
MSTKRSLWQRKTEGDWKKGLANMWGGKKITKKAHAGRGQETKWEIPVKDIHPTIVCQITGQNWAIIRPPKIITFFNYFLLTSIWESLKFSQSRYRQERVN